MKENYLTVKEVAEQLGISVQAVYKRMDKDFKPFIVEVENKKLLKYGVLKQFSLNKNSTKVENSAEVESLEKYINHLEKEVEQLRAEKEALNQELAEERKHSREQSDKLAVLADQSQQLQLALLTTSSAPTALEEQNTAKKTKRHWWQRKK